MEEEVNKLNKAINLNLIIVRLKNTKKLESTFENFLINLNKKVLIISDNQLEFGKSFIYRVVNVIQNISITSITIFNMVQNSFSKEF